MPVGIVGGRGSGKSVFVSLLAQTAISYSIEERFKKFRYFTEPEFTDLIGEIIVSMKAQNWPAATMKSILSKYNFYFGYQTVMSKLTKRPMFNVVKFNMFDIAGEDVESVKYAADEANKRGRDPMDVLPQTLKTVLDCNVLIFLIDTENLTSGSDEKRGRMLEYDTLMADLLSLAATFKSRNSTGGKESKLYPVFVLTKFDRMEPQILEAIGFPNDALRSFKAGSRQSKSSSINRKERTEYANRLLAQFMQHTLAIKAGSRLKGVNMDDARFFFSYIGTERNKLAMFVPRIVQSEKGGSYELDYSSGEYQGLIDFIGEISKEIKDTEEDESSVKFLQSIG